MSLSHEVLISCIDECTEDDEEDQSNLIQDVDCLLTESSQPINYQRNTNLVNKQRALLK
mgnify:CR=1 FL=1